LATDGVRSFIIFLYADGLIQWTTGDASGGTNGLGGNEATAGYDAGDGENYFNIPGSGNPEILNIARTSNVGKPGMWMFSTLIEGVCLSVQFHKHIIGTYQRYKILDLHIILV